MWLIWINAPWFFLHSPPWLFGEIRKCAECNDLEFTVLQDPQTTPANLTGNCTDIFPRAFPQASTADSNNSKLHLRWGIWDKNDHYKQCYRVSLLGDPIWSATFTLLWFYVGVSGATTQRTYVQIQMRTCSMQRLWKEAKALLLGTHARFLKVAALLRSSSTPQQLYSAAALLRSTFNPQQLYSAVLLLHSSFTPQLRLCY